MQDATPGEAGEGRASRVSSMKKGAGSLNFWPVHIHNLTGSEERQGVCVWGEMGVHPTPTRFKKTSGEAVMGRGPHPLSGST